MKRKRVTAGLIRFLFIAFFALIAVSATLISACGKNADAEIEKDAGSGGAVDESKWNVSDGLAVGFFSDTDCPQGDIDESKSKRELNSKLHERQYMVADFTIQAPQDNDGKESVTAEVKISPASAASATVQETNTGNVEEKTENDITTIKAVYRIPDKAEVERKIRLVIRIDAADYGLADVSLKLNCPEDMPAVSAKSFEKQAVMGYTEDLEYEGSTVTGIGESAGNIIVIPTEHDGVAITSIKEDALRQSNAVRVIINANIKSIPRQAFKNSVTLKKVTLPEGFTSIGYEAFSGCKKLSEINIPDSVTFIGSAAFGYCGELKNVRLPAGLKTLDSNAFRECASLTEINIPAGVEKVGDSAFSGCTGLTEVTVSDGVTKIGSGAFYNCAKLFEVTLPKSIASIGSKAFNNCRSLKNIIYGGTKEEWEAVLKTADWNTATGGYVVHCTDGDVAKN